MELEIVTMVVLGGVNILGGSGSIPGVVLAAFIMGFVMSIFLGLLLIGVIAVPRLLARRSKRA
jgi:rhamnose transport system permease protein